MQYKSLKKIALRELMTVKKAGRATIPWNTRDVREGSRRDEEERALEIQIKRDLFHQMESILAGSDVLTLREASVDEAGDTVILSAKGGPTEYLNIARTDVSHWIHSLRGALTFETDQKIEAQALDLLRQTTDVPRWRRP